MSTSQRRRIIGLTGGIATGKTTVANYLTSTYQMPILDADLYAREAVQRGSPILHAIAQRYGSGVLQSDGTLNRARLGEIIFNSPQERQWLEQQIHPYVRDRLIEARDQLPLDQTVVLVVPLLFEARMTDLVTEIWVVKCSPAQLAARLMARNHLTREQAQARIDSQISLQDKCARADIVLDNSSTLTALHQQIDRALINLSGG